MKPKKLLVELIEETADTQARVALSQETIDEYAEQIGAILDAHPIVVFFNGKEYFIADGWHRFHAAVQAGLNIIPCDVRDGSERDALLYAAAANKTHGLKRTNRDKRRAVEIMLVDDEWSEWSDRRIAEHCGVSHTFVSELRVQVTTVATSDDGEDESQVSESDTSNLPEAPAKRVGRDGKSYPVKPKPAAAPAADEDEASGPDLAALSLPYRESAKLLDEMRRKFEALAKKPEGAQLVPKIQRLASEFAAVKATIRGAEPMAVCGKCEGEGCQHCARTGFWTRMVVDSLKK